MNAMEVYSDPAPLRATSPDRSVTPSWAGVKKACSSASRTSGVVIDLAARQPMIRRAYASITNAKYTVPVHVGDIAEVRYPTGIRGERVEVAVNQVWGGRLCSSLAIVVRSVSGVPMPSLLETATIAACCEG